MDSTKQVAIVCDLDGTLSLFEAKGHRGPYDAAKCDQDELNVPVAKVLEWAKQAGYAIILLSGREDKFRAPTLKFLETHKVAYDHLFMRETRDKRKDSIIKWELYEEHIAPNYEVLFFLDDRDSVVNDAWRAHGLTCFQVAPGNF